MHVLTLTDYLGNVGGAELSARTIATGLTACEDVTQVTVVGIDLPSAEPLEFPGATVDPVSLPERIDYLPDYLADLLIERLLARRVRRYLDDVDLIHAHHRRSTLALAHLDTRVPTVGTVRDYWPVCPISVYSVDGEQCTGCDDRLDDCTEYQGWDGITEPATKRYLRAKRGHNRAAFDGVDRAVFISNHLRKRVSASLQTPPSTVIYNPVSVDRTPHLEPPEPPVFVTASSLTKEKGVDLAVAAMDQLRRTHPNAKLIVFGNGPQRNALEHQAATLPDGTVTFRGRVSPEEVYEMIRSATATVFPSRWDEPFGRVTVESMQLGTPVVGAAVGGIAEIVEEGRTGRLFERDDAEALAEALRTLCNDEEEWSDLARAGIEVGEHFEAEHITDEHLSWYRTLSTEPESLE